MREAWVFVLYFYNFKITCVHISADDNSPKDYWGWHLFRVIQDTFFFSLPSFFLSLLWMRRQCSQFDQLIYLSWGYLQNLIEYLVEIRCLLLHKRTSLGFRSIPQVLGQLWSLCFQQIKSSSHCFFPVSDWVGVVGGAGGIPINSIAFQKSGEL